MKKMHVSVFEPWATISVILLNLIMLVFFYKNNVPFGLSLLMFLLTNLFNYGVSVKSLHQFDYNNEFLIITNSWNPFFSIQYRIADIDKIEVESYNGLGNAIDVYCLGKKQTYGSRVALNRLDEMVMEIGFQLKTNQKM